MFNFSFQDGTSSVRSRWSFIPETLCDTFDCFCQNFHSFQAVIIIYFETISKMSFEHNEYISWDSLLFIHISQCSFGRKKLIIIDKIWLHKVWKSSADQFKLVSQPSCWIGQACNISQTRKCSSQFSRHKQHHQQLSKLSLLKATPPCDQTQKLLSTDFHIKRS